jgi:hypothetical protein
MGGTFFGLTDWKTVPHSRNGTSRWPQLVPRAGAVSLPIDEATPGVRWHRQLTENIGVRALVSRCYEVVGMAKQCADMRELRDKVARHYGRQVVQFS